MLVLFVSPVAVNAAPINVPAFGPSNILPTTDPHDPPGRQTAMQTEIPKLALLLDSAIATLAVQFPEPNVWAANGAEMNCLNGFF